MQFVYLLLVVCISLTRISDHMHHWTDVLVGLLLGTAVAVHTAFYISDLFRPSANPYQEEVEQGQDRVLGPPYRGTNRFDYRYMTLA